MSFNSRTVFVNVDIIDIINEEIADNLLFDENREYTYETPLGEMKITGSDLSFLIEEFNADVAEIGYKPKAAPYFVENYLAMTSAERKTFHNSYDKELNYRDYTEETYRTTFGSESIAELADQILAAIRTFVSMIFEESSEYSILATTLNTQSAPLYRRIL